MIERNGKHYVLTCDLCGNDAPETFLSFREAVDYKKVHWHACKAISGWHDMCTKCKTIPIKGMLK